MTPIEDLTAIRDLARTALEPFKPEGVLDGFDDEPPNDCKLMVCVSHVQAAHQLKASGKYRDRFLQLLEYADCARGPDVYLTSLFKHRAYKIRYGSQEQHDEITQISNEVLIEEVRIVKPRVVILVGDPAVRAVFGNVSASSVQGNLTTRRFANDEYRTFVASQMLHYGESTVRSAFDRAGAILKSGGKV